jgi:SAM-dependent MidA family methyltransferase
MTPTAGGSRLPASLEQQSLEVEAHVREAVLGSPEHWIPFDEFVQRVQYAPGLGYYSAGSEKLGAGGDFVTAPELSALFGRCVARQCAQVLTQYPAGEATILELGAGSGALAETLLRTLLELGSLPARYCILEVSADLRARQQQRLSQLPASLAGRVQWLDALPAVPISGVIVANEVADALPFKRFVLSPGVIDESGVALSSEGRLIETAHAADAALAAEVRRICGPTIDVAMPGYTSELCPMLAPWIAALAAALQSGVILLIDYGLSRRDYYDPHRTRGTMRCHFRHYAHDDPLLYMGLQDISAWVDFTRVAEAASDAGLDVRGYCTQAAFLLATGIEADVASVGPAASSGSTRSAVEQARLAGQARTLLLPGEMGENFKAMLLTRAFDQPPLGFRYQDLRGSL